jgi:hypothetical protein
LAIDNVVSGRARVRTDVTRVNIGGDITKPAFDTKSRMNLADTINVASSKLGIKMIPISVLICHLLELVFNKEKATVTRSLEVSDQRTIKKVNVA